MSEEVKPEITTEEQPAATEQPAAEEQPPKVTASNSAVISNCHFSKEHSIVWKRWGYQKRSGAKCMQYTYNS